jgi:hypothetical protein
MWLGIVYYFLDGWRLAHHFSSGPRILIDLPTRVLLFWLQNEGGINSDCFICGGNHSHSHLLRKAL